MISRDARWRQFSDGQPSSSAARVVGRHRSRPMKTLTLAAVSFTALLSLTTEAQAVTVCPSGCDHTSIDAVREGGEGVLIAGSTSLEVGDRLLIGGLGRLVVQPASWLGDEPPGELTAAPVAPEVVAEVLDTARSGGDLSEHSAAVLDAAWVAAFRRWRRSPGAPNVFELRARMCSAATLIALREGLDDPGRWFVDGGLDVVRMLASAPTRSGSRSRSTCAFATAVGAFARSRASRSGRSPTVSARA